MSNDVEAKIDVINRMITSLGKLTNVEIRLRLAGDTDRADTVAASYEELREEIDRLRGHVADEWTMDAEQLREGLRKANERVQRSIRNIQLKIEVARNVVNVIGQVDGALKALRGLIPGAGGMIGGGG